ncbi:hypothetical protein RF11_11697 [Thelohanellus kitauei]|uniref:Uncharacterized protein n=1 Tax=Thelohanellus kitauei TaxID=669202 RepID=A0A0C2J0B6_THEKT|nr:hypothetical protein RF11_11697 [Thelohanellus kitauei]
MTISSCNALLNSGKLDNTTPIHVSKSKIKGDKLRKFRHIQFHPSFDNINARLREFYATHNIEKKFEYSYRNALSTHGCFFNFNHSFRERIQENRIKMPSQVGNNVGLYRLSKISGIKYEKDAETTTTTNINEKDEAQDKNHSNPETKDQEKAIDPCFETMNTEYRPLCTKIFDPNDPDSYRSARDLIFSNIDI